MTVSHLTAVFALSLVAVTGITEIAVAQDIHEAARQGDVASVSALLSQDTGLVNSTDARDCTPLHFAAGSGSREVAELLLAQGAEVNAQNHEHETPLHWAALRSRGEVVALLLDHGADTEMREDYGRTPLLLVARETGNVEVTTLLIDGGADVDARDRFGDTPLGLAAWRGFAGTVNLLLGVRDREGTGPAVSATRRCRRRPEHAQRQRRLTAPLRVRRQIPGDRRDPAG
jgi:ankyrin repeat protein